MQLQPAPETLCMLAPIAELLLWRLRDARVGGDSEE